MSNQSNNLAFVFPGQGSQTVGMLANLSGHYPSVKHTFARASEVLGLDLWRIVTENFDNELDQTHNTQPIMLAAGFAVWEIWCKLSPVRPAWMAGHSLGEYTALVCSDALSFEDAIGLVALRGRLMQEAVPEGMGAMAAILGLSDQDVVDVCADVANDEVVAAVNFNTLGQVVIAGHAAAVERAMLAAKNKGAKRVLPIPVSVPSHCELMKPAAEKLSGFLLDVSIATPQVKLIHNVDAESHSDPVAIKHILVEQLYRPVRWVDTVETMAKQGVDCFVECGPGKVLLGLNKRIAKHAGHFALYDQKTLDDLLEAQQSELSYDN
ncbi:MAG: ACP S-malonyltransferase [Methylovulum sp.]|uniref:ACP S-malonyltransferase n=1 Tax=Methylovulum sp. TaxID=1916980 RepID=UPI00261D22BE|nr:ACP S-malonyltransferase [Methylovulum sp.]MDD2723910.1 ACP S-malonyltransferase [Methylovulum sp.]MDD5125239.1 ACP S-malonyltransferase [Methylovulum sp.]